MAVFELASELGIIQEAHYGFGEMTGRLWWHQESGNAFVDQLGIAAHGCSDYWQSSGHGLEQRIGKSLAM